MSPVAQGHALLCEHWHSKWVSWSLPSAEHCHHPAELTIWGSPAPERLWHAGWSKSNRSPGWLAGWSIQCLRLKKMSFIFKNKRKRGEISLFILDYLLGWYKEDQVKLFQTLLGAESSTNERKLTVSATQKSLTRYRRKILKWSPTAYKDCPWRYSQLDWVWPGAVRFDF